MSHIAFLPRRPPRLARRRLIAATLIALSGGLAAWRVVASANAAFAASAVTNDAGRVTFNFRVAGLPVPGRIDDVDAHVAFRRDDLASATGTVRVPLAGLTTGIALRDRHARKFLGVGTHPTAEFVLKRVTGLPKGARLSAARPLNAFAEGTFRLRGVTESLRAPITLTLDAAGKAVNVETRFDVVFAKHRISIPGADAASDVTVTFRLPLP